MPARPQLGSFLGTAVSSRTSDVLSVKPLGFPWETEDPFLFCAYHDDAYPRGVAVRFVRKGDSRAELDLPALKMGQTANLRLPSAVCAGVVRSRVEIQALGANSPSGTSAGTIGEYDLRC